MLLLFEHNGVEEYSLYDTAHKELSGFTPDELGLTPTENMYLIWVSPLLNIRFDMSVNKLQLFRPDGSLFSTYQEVPEQVELAEQKSEIAEQKALKLAEKLKDLGINPDQI